MKKILLIDNQDSFVYNIYHMLNNITNKPIDIYSNDNIPFNKLHTYNYIIISPGPGIPEEAGDLMKLISVVEKTHPIFGICLGLQAIAVHFGAKLFNLRKPLHGHSSILHINNQDPVLGSLNNEGSKHKSQKAGLYHSWAVDKKKLPSCLQIGSVNEEGIIMSVYHNKLPIYGLQFHPESILTPSGTLIIEKWISNN